MAGSEHFMFAEETVLGTWVAPNKALFVRSSNLTGAQPLMIPDETGGGRGQPPGAPGEISASGNFVANLRPTVLGHLLRSNFATRAQTTAGTGGFRNKLLIDDDVAFESFSVQKRYRDDLAESLRGVKVTGWTIAARTREFAQITVDMVGKDSTITGGTWSDATSAPAVVDPVPYEATPPPAFKFYEGVMRLGGSVALTAGELVVTGGTARNDFDNIEIATNFNVGTDAYGVNLGDRTVQTLDEGRREITVRFDPNFNTTSNEFYLAWKNGARAVVELYFEGPEYFTGNKHQMKITLPWVVYSSGANPEINTAYGLKRHTVEGSAFVDPTTDADIGLVIQTTEDLSL